MKIFGLIKSENDLEKIESLTSKISDVCRKIKNCFGKIEPRAQSCQQQIPEITQFSGQNFYFFIEATI